MRIQIESYPNSVKILHLGLAAFGVFAFLTGELAEDGGSTGYLLHAYLGMSLGLFLVSYVINRVHGAGDFRPGDWALFAPVQWSLALQDIKGLLRRELPRRNRHEGLAGITQAVGLLIFAVMAVTGAGLFMLAGGPESSVFEILEELHEAAAAIIPIYLLLHVGAVILHTMAGDPIGKKMFSFSKR